MSTTNPTCSIEGCDRPHHGRGWCHLHWQRWRTHGDPLRERPTPAERFWANVNKRGPDDCWLWAGGCVQGYGQFQVGGRAGRSGGAHRFAYELLVEAVPDGLYLHHVCENTLCVNPAHLEPVSPAEHLRLHDTCARAAVARIARTTCPHGHPKDTYGRHNGRQWVCRECQRLGWHRRKRLRASAV